MTLWVVFGVLVTALVIGGIFLWRRWPRWNPAFGTSPQAKAAETRLWSTRHGDQTGGL
jgi:hypothetical protein